MKQFDAIIIGSGQAGTPLAFSLANSGKTVAFVEKNKIGGTCLNVGCTPTKTYVASARKMWDVRHGEELGIEIPTGARTDLAKVKERKDNLINDSREGIEKAIAKNPNITFYYGEASFKSDKIVKISNELLTAELIFINVGTRPNVPRQYQSVKYLTNESILEITALPKHLVVIGGSYIGLEFGQMFSRFGSEVTIIERSEHLVRREDEEVSLAIEDICKSEGIRLILNAKCLSAEENADQTITVKTKCEQNPIVTGTHLLLGIGRTPNTDTLRLENTNIEADKHGFITVNDYCETNINGVFALGDCNGKGAFTHTSYNDYQIVENYLLGDQRRKISDRIQTYGLFIDPPLGRAGMTKKEALAKGFKILEARREMATIARAKEKGETKGFMSVIINAENNFILGTAVLGVGGDEIVTGILNVMNAKLPYTAIRDSMVLHPTISELIPTILERPKTVE